MRAAGSPEAWFEAQLDPAAIADAKADAFQSWWVSIDLDAAAIWQRDQAEIEGGWAAMANYARWCLLRRIYSERQVLEVMTEFWENHLHVPLHDDGVFTYRADYGKVIRSHALGRFDEMLVAAITHPAMGISLDNARSTKKAPNENLGRELLELHTVGKGNHTEDDVKNSARILTGYRVDMWTPPGASYYDTASHWTGAVKVLDFTHANADPDGRAGHRGVPDLPGPPPEDRREDRPEARGPVRLRHPLRRARRTPRPGVPRQRHRDQAGAAGTRRLRGVQGRCRRRRCAPPPTTWSPPTGCSAPRSPGRSTTTRRRTRSCGRPPASARSRSTGPDPTGSPRTTAPGRRRRGCWPPSTSTTRWRGGGGPSRTSPTATRWRGCPPRASGSTRWWTTCPSSSSASRVPARLLQACMRGHRGRRRHHDHRARTPIMRWQFPLLLTTLLDSPDHMHR